MLSSVIMIETITILVINANLIVMDKLNTRFLYNTESVW